MRIGLVGRDVPLDDTVQLQQPSAGARNACARQRQTAGVRPTFIGQPLRTVIDRCYGRRFLTGFRPDAGEEGKGLLSVHNFAP